MTGEVGDALGFMLSILATSPVVELKSAAKTFHSHIV